MRSDVNTMISFSGEWCKLSGEVRCGFIGGSLTRNRFTEALDSTGSSQRTPGVFRIDFTFRELYFVVVVVDKRIRSDEHCVAKTKRM